GNEASYPLEMCSHCKGFPEGGSQSVCERDVFFCSFVLLFVGVGTAVSNLRWLESLLEEDNNIRCPVDADEIKRLGKRFKKLDLDNSGSLSVEEFMSLPELQQNPLVQRVIDIFDTDGNGEVDFKEFIEGVSQFSVKGDKEQKLRCDCFQDLRHGQGRLHLQRRALPGAEDDGGQQPEGHAAPADRGQDHHQRRQGRRWQDILRRVLRSGRRSRYTQKDGGGRVSAPLLADSPPFPPRQPLFSTISEDLLKTSGKTHSNRMEVFSRSLSLYMKPLFSFLKRQAS
ncbi:unnamed protein product, partial [Tetraodon nigroviridis]